MENLNELVVEGVIQTKLNADDWTEVFIEWLESRNEYFGGGVKPCENESR